MLVSAGLFCIVYGFSNAQQHTWGAASTWGFLLVGVVLLVAFVWWQRRARQPLLPMRVVTDRDRGASYLAMFISGAGLFGVFLFLTYYLQRSLSYSPVMTGLAFLPMIAVIMVTSVTTTNVLVPRFGAKPIVPTGMLLSAGAMAWFTALDNNSTYAAHVLPPLLLLGLGLGLIFATAMNLATAGVKEQRRRRGLRDGQHLAAGRRLHRHLTAQHPRHHAAANYLVGKRPSAAVAAQAQLHSYSTAYWWSAALFAAGFLVTVLLYRRGLPRSLSSPAAESTAAPM